MTPGPRGLRLCALAAIAAACGLPAPAGAALRYDATLGAGVELSDNANFAPERPPEGRSGAVETSVATYVAGLHLRWEAGGDLLDLSYQGRYRNVGEETIDLTSGWVHLGRAEFSWRRWDPFFLEVVEQRDRAALYREEIDVDLPSRRDRNRVLAGTGLAWAVGRTARVATAVRGEWESFPGMEGADSTQALSAEIEAENRWSPLLDGRGRVAYGRVRQELAPDHDVAEVEAELTRRFSPRLRATGALTWRREWYDHVDEGVDGLPPDGGLSGAERDLFLKSLAVEGILGRGATWTLAYADSTDRLPDGTDVRIGRASVEVSLAEPSGSRLRLGAWHEDRDFRGAGRQDRVWGPVAEARWVMGGWAALTLGGSWTRTDRREEGLESRRYGLAEVGPGVVVLLGKRTQLEAGYRLRKNDAPAADEAYVSNAWYLMVSASLRPRMPGVFPESVAGQLGSLSE